LGREDGVVKVGGKRVDTEEIRERMRSFGGVRDAVVAVLPAKAGRRTALGALVEGNVDPAELRRHLADRLEPHALPRLFRVVEKIPVTAAGKVDRERVLALLVG
jgi:acyl-coenzyme A synthetase/AMP-(fatty) acid ligase